MASRCTSNGTGAQLRDAILAPFDCDLEVNVGSVGHDTFPRRISTAQCTGGIVKARIIDGRPTVKLMRTTDRRNPMIDEKENDST